MKRYMLRAVFALAAIALVLLPSVATAADFGATFTGSAWGTHDGKYWVFTATGTGTRVGSCSLEVAYHFYGGTRVVGMMTMTTANGDVLKGSCEHTWDAATTTWFGSYTFTGGTGRFAKAVGSGNFNVPLDLTAGTAAPTLTGTISL